MATLTVSVKEAITLNNIDYGSERSLDISSVNEVVKRVVTASTTECGLIGFISAISGVGVTANKVGYVAGIFDNGDVRYIRITNLDSSNHIMLCQVVPKELEQRLQDGLPLCQHPVRLLCTKFITMLDRSD